MQHTRSLISVISCNFFLILAIVLFYISILPPRDFLASSEPDQWTFDSDLPEHAPFNKLIFMVVDALRSDFVYGHNSGFEFAQGLIRNNAAIPYTLKASSPSLTRSCVKAMTLGATPSFSDILSNVQAVSEVADADTWLTRLQRRDPEGMVFHGDDTWLQLYPGLFNRSHGVSTMWGAGRGVTDAVVTQSALNDVHRDDWSTMVIHYAGIDEIGHMAGPQSPLMIPKQADMDSVVKFIYQAMDTEAHLNSTLFILLGDHGMNEQGNHGGREESETSAALLFISPYLRHLEHGYGSPTGPTHGSFGYYKTVEQYDIVPTISSLLGVPVPRNSRGVLIRDFLELWGTIKDRVSLLLANIQQLTSLAVASNATFSLHDVGLDTLLEDRRENANTTSWTTKGPPGPQDLTHTLGNLLKATEKLKIILDQQTVKYSLLPIIYISIACVITALGFCRIGYSQSQAPWSFDGAILIVINIVHSLLMFSTRATHHEDQFWCWTSQIWLGYLFLRRRKSEEWTRTAYSSVPFFLQFISLWWNQTYHSSHFMTVPFQAYPALRFVGIWSLVTMAYWSSGSRLMKSLRRDPRWSFLTTILTCAIPISTVVVSFVFKLLGTLNDFPRDSSPVPLWVLHIDQALMAQYVFLALFIMAMYVVVSKNGFDHRSSGKILSGTPRFEILIELINIYLMTQSDPGNIPLFMVFNIQANVIVSSQPSFTAVQTCVTSILLSHSSFFAFGSSNSIGTLKYINGFNGLHQYNAVAFLFQTICSTWAGPIWWTCNSSRMLPLYGDQSHKANTTERSYKPFIEWFVLQTVFVACHILSVIVACVWPKIELDVRETFIPSFIYASFWVGMIHLLAGGVIFLALWRIY